MIYLIYHRMDLDGFCSLAIAMNSLGHHNIDKTYKTLGYHYGDTIDFSQFVDATEFVFMDVFPSPYEEMYEKFKAICPKIVVCDHHKTFIESTVPQCVEGIWTTSKAGCECTWNWFNHTEKMPKFVRYLGMYDSWRNKDKELWENCILPFQYGAKLMLDNPSTDFAYWWKLLHFDPNELFLNEIVQTGTILMQEADHRSAKVMSNNAFSATFAGLHVLCCNDGTYSSNLFNSMWDESKYDAMLGFCIRNTGLVSVSLYATSDDVDCTPVAKSFGGGGHAHACGFTVSAEMFFKLLKKDEV